MHLATIRCNCAPAAALDVDYYVANFRLTPPPQIFNFFPNFKCLWGPPRLVRSSSPSGYILSWSLPVAYWVVFFCFFQSVSWETHYSTCYLAASCHVSQFFSWGRRPERGIFREEANSNTVNISHITWRQKSLEGWANVVNSWTLWTGTILRGTPWGMFHLLSAALAVVRFVQVKLGNRSQALYA